MRRKIAALYLVPALLGIGCMLQDGPGKGGVESSQVKDENLLAGATSSTNWPAGEDGSVEKILLEGVSDSDIHLEFKKQTGESVSLSGDLILYRAGTIPLIESPDSILIHFETTNTITLKSKVFLDRWKGSDDSVQFSLLVKSDTLQWLLVEFVYNRKSATFQKTPFSINSLRYASTPRYSVHGWIDSSLSKLGFSITGKSEWCFYIPGSPFFWKTKPDTAIDLGPLPRGDFPFRLLRITQASDASGKNLLEVYEVKLLTLPIDQFNLHLRFYMVAGNLLFSTPLNASQQIRELGE